MVVYLIGISLIWASLAGVQGAWFGELFPTNTRNSGVSLGYQLASSISGFAPFLAGTLAATFGWIGGSVFYMSIGAIGLIGVLVTRETWTKRDRERVSELLRSEPLADTTERANMR
jgi:MFS family permease